MRLVAGVILLMLVGKAVSAHYYKHYTTSNGFGDNTVYHIVRDSKGYLWFCTQKGVVQYNGSDFKKYTVEDGLTDNDVFKCYEDHLGRVWFYTFNGEYCYYRNDTIYNSTNDTFLRKLPVASYVIAMYDDLEDSALYIGHDFGSIIKVRNGQVTHILDSLKENDKLKYIYKHKGRLKGTAFRTWFDIAVDTISNIQPMSIHDSYVYDSMIVTSDEVGVKLYNDRILVWHVDDPEVAFSNLNHLFYDGDGHVLCGGKNGLIVYDIRSNEKSYYFNNISITCSVMDIHGNYWLSSIGHGVFRINRGQFEDVTLMGDVHQSTLFITPARQLFMRKGDKVSAFTEQGGEVSVRDMSLCKTCDPMYLTDSFFVYYQVYKNGFYLEDIRTGITRLYSNNAFYKLFVADSNRFVFMDKINMKTFNYRYPFFLSAIDSSVFTNNIFGEVYVKETNSVYFFSNNKLYRYNVSKLSLSVIDTIEHVGGNSYMFYESGCVISLTNSSHLHIYTADERHKKVADLHMEYPVYYIAKINTGEYLIETDEGHKVVTFTPYPFNIRENIITYPFEQNDIRGIYPVGGNHFVCRVGDELYSFNKSILNKYYYRPKLFVKEVVLNGNEHIPVKGVISVRNKTGIKILLSPVCFSIEQLAFRYRVADDDETTDWVETNTAELSFLFDQPGEKTIEVQAIASGRQKSDIERVRLYIRPPFYSTVPFYMICVLCGGGLLILAFVYNNRVRRKVFEREMKFIQLEYKAVNSLLNPHFIFNAINNIQNLVNHDSKELANNYLAILSRLIRQNIDNLQFNLIPIGQELELIKYYIELQNLRFNNEIGFTIDNDVPEDVYVPPLLVHTFVENAIVHGYDKSVNDFAIHLQLQMSVDEYLVVVVTDNGLGIEATRSAYPDKKKVSLGISFTRERLKRLSEFYKLQYSLMLNDLSASGIGSGTEVIIILYSGFKSLVDPDKLMPAR